MPNLFSTLNEMLKKYLKEMATAQVFSCEFCEHYKDPFFTEPRMENCFWKFPVPSVALQLLCNFIKITLRHGCSPVNLLHIFRTPFTKNISGGCFWSKMEHFANSH